jgi:hypothetical protein
VRVQSTTSVFCLACRACDAELALSDVFDSTTADPAEFIATHAGHPNGMLDVEIRFAGD